MKLVTTTAFLPLLFTVFCVFINESQQVNIQPKGDYFSKGKGESIMFACSLDNNEPITNENRLKWIKDGVNEITDRQGSRVYIESNSKNLKLYVKTIEASDGGTYRCDGIVNDEPQSKTVALEIYEPIKFIVENNQYPVIGEDAVIKCKATGSPKPEISWSYNGQKVATGDKYIITDEGLLIRSVRDPEDNGAYTCHAEIIDRGTVEEEVINVEVHIPPTITTEPGTVEGNEDSTVILRCAASGKPTPKFRFYKDGSGDAPIASSDRIKVDEVNGLLEFKPVAKSDDGDYRCEAYNGAGSPQSGDGKVFVTVKPRINRFEDVTYVEGNTATLVCEVIADPPAQIVFSRELSGMVYVDDENDDGRIYVTKIDNNKAQLSISALTKEDSGAYTCKATNKVGEIASKATLSVHYRPFFHENHPVKFYAWTGKQRNMTCSPMGEPQPQISWFTSADRPVDHNDPSYTLFDLGGQSVLQVKVTDENDDYVYQTYKCRASNQVGPSDASIELDKAYVPAAPKQVTVINSRPTSIRLQVQPPDDTGNMPIVRYQISQHDSSNVFYVDVGSEIVVKNLSPAKMYLFTVYAENEVGTGPGTDVEAVTENESAPFTIQIDSPKKGTHAFSYDISWASPETGGKNITAYKFNWRRVKADISDPEQWKFVEQYEHWNEKVEPNKPSDMTHYSLADLQADMYYELKIEAQNELGWSPEISPPFIFHTARKLQDVRPVHGSDAMSHGVSLCSLFVCFLLAALTSLSL